MTDALWIAEADVASMLDMAAAIEFLEAGLRAEAKGEAENMTKTHVAWEGGTLHALGAVFARAGVAGTKTWAHTEGGATPLLVLYDSGSGALRAVIEAFALGQLRTAAASGVATRWMAARDADEMAILGTGRQALAQVAAVAAVRPLRRVRVFGRDLDRRQRLAARIEQELGVAAQPYGGVAEAVHGAAIVTTATRATEPFLEAGMVAQGAHVNAIGAIVPSGAELAEDLVRRSGRVVVDSVPQAQRLSRELRARFGPGPHGWEEVRRLSDVVAHGEPRGTGEDVSLFKSLGMGISDVALGMRVHEEAHARGLGRRLPPPQRAAPRLARAGIGVESGKQRL